MATVSVGIVTWKLTNFRILLHVYYYIVTTHLSFHYLEVKCYIIKSYVPNSMSNFPQTYAQWSPISNYGVSGQVLPSQSMEKWLKSLC